MGLRYNFPNKLIIAQCNDRDQYVGPIDCREEVPETASISIVLPTEFTLEQFSEPVPVDTQ
jgi:hypothetical protein